MKKEIKNFLLDMFIFGAFYIVGKYISESYFSGWAFGSLAMVTTLLIDKIRENKNKCEKTCTIKKD